MAKGQDQGTVAPTVTGTSDGSGGDDVIILTLPPTNEDGTYVNEIDYVEESLNPSSEVEDLGVIVMTTSGTASPTDGKDDGDTGHDQPTENAGGGDSANSNTVQEAEPAAPVELSAPTTLEDAANDGEYSRENPVPAAVATTAAPTIPATPPAPLPASNATLTDLAQQELGTWLNQEKQLSQVDVDGDETEPSEMDIEVPESPEEEEVIDEEIEEWDEAHGKADLPQTDADGEVTEPSEMGIEVPVTAQEEEEIDEEIEEWEEEHGKKKKQPSTTTNSNGNDNNNDNNVTQAAGIPPTPEQQVVEEPSTVSKKAEEEGDGGIISTEQATEAPIETPTSDNTPLVAPPTDPKLPSNASPTLPPTKARPNDCHDYGPHTVAAFSCRTGIPSIVPYGFFVFLPLLLIGCCWRYCCKKSPKSDSAARGEYRAIANTYDFDNAFADTFSDDEEEDFFEEDASWRNNGEKVLEMKDLGVRRGDDDLDLDEMNG